MKSASVVTEMLQSPCLQIRSIKFICFFFKVTVCILSNFSDRIFKMLKFQQSKGLYFSNFIVFLYIWLCPASRIINIFCLGRSTATTPFALAALLDLHGKVLVSGGCRGGFREKLLEAASVLKRASSDGS